MVAAKKTDAEKYKVLSDYEKQLVSSKVPTNNNLGDYIRLEMDTYSKKINATVDTHALGAKRAEEERVRDLEIKKKKVDEMAKYLHEQSSVIATKTPAKTSLDTLSSTLTQYVNLLEDIKKQDSQFVTDNHMAISRNTENAISKHQNVTSSPKPVIQKTTPPVSPNFNRKVKRIGPTLLEIKTSEINELVNSKEPENIKERNEYIEKSKRLIEEITSKPTLKLKLTNELKKLEADMKKREEKHNALDHLSGLKKTINEDEQLRKDAEIKALTEKRERELIELERKKVEEQKRLELERAKKRPWGFEEYENIMATINDESTLEEVNKAKLDMRKLKMDPRMIDEEIRKKTTTVLIELAARETELEAKRAEEQAKVDTEKRRLEFEEKKKQEELDFLKSQEDVKRRKEETARKLREKEEFEKSLQAATQKKIRDAEYEKETLRRIEEKEKGLVIWRDEQAPLMTQGSRVDKFNLEYNNAVMLRTTQQTGAQCGYHAAKNAVTAIGGGYLNPDAEVDIKEWADEETVQGYVTKMTGNHAAGDLIYVINTVDFIGGDAVDSTVDGAKRLQQGHRVAFVINTVEVGSVTSYNSDNIPGGHWFTIVVSPEGEFAIMDSMTNAANSTHKSVAEKLEKALEKNNFKPRSRVVRKIS